MEVWKSIPDLAGHYEVSSSGRVRSVDKTLICADGRKRNFKGKVLSPTAGKSGYLTFKVAHLGMKTFYVHRVVCEAFHGVAPIGHEACHRNGIRSDNRADNLRWGSRSENSRDRHKHKTMHGKLSYADAAKIRIRYQPYDSVNGASAMAREFGVSKKAIFDVLTKRTYPEVS